MYRVYLVDDEPFILDGLGDAVDWSSYGLEVVGKAENGKNAFEALRTMHVDLLVTDITMPEMNGLELIASIRLIQPDLKVIILSGYNEFEYLKVGMTLGIENYLLKPVNFTELGETLHNVVDKLNASEANVQITDEDMDVLKDNIMYRWMTGRISQEELAERNRLLRIDLSCSYVLAAVIRSEKDFGQLYALTKQWLGTDGHEHCFRDIDGDMIIVFLIEDEEAGKRRAIERLQVYLREIGSNEVRISVGSMARIGSNEASSYAHAKQAQQYFLVLDRPEMAEYDKLPLHRSEVRLPQAAFDWNEYTKLMLSKDIVKLSAAIEEDFKLTQSMSGSSPELLHSIAAETLVRLKMELNAVKPDEQLAAESFKHALEKVMRASTIDEITNVIINVASLAIDSLDNDDKSPIIKQVLSHIRDSYSQVMSLKALGRQYNIHPVYLGHLFHKETNESFTDYVNHYRIEKAKELLKDTSMKVHDIAEMVGYTETGYFYKQFKKHVGISPTDYKGLL